MKLALAMLLAVGAPVAPGTTKVQQGRGTGPSGEWQVQLLDGGTVTISGVVSVNIVDGGTLATDANAALIALELVNGTTVVRVMNLPTPVKKNPFTGAAKVDGSDVVQPVSVVKLPLPTGAAQEAGGNLAAILAALSSPPLAAAVTVVQQPLNPFLPRCNAVRRLNCQP